MGPLETSAFFRESCDAGFVDLDAEARNMAWTSQTRWGELEVTVNLSKPEKDPRDIAAAGTKVRSATAYTDPATGRVRACPLCVEDADVSCGYARTLNICGEKWGLWFSPYSYYREHCICMSWEHRPMHIDRPAFEGLFDAVEAAPHYFFGSNADLPLVGGSILGHDHFQGGRHVFALQKAPLAERFELPGASGVQAGIVKWPVSVIRLTGTRREQIVDAACAVLDAWCGYDDPQAGIVSGIASMHAGDDAPAFSAGRAKVHNTITPILMRTADCWQLDLALRCNVTSPEHPLGVFHPHADLHHIKKENIGLIEVMGLAILPPRVKRVMQERKLSRDDVAGLFARVLEDAGVFKWDDSGRKACERFIAQLVDAQVKP